MVIIDFFSLLLLKENVLKASEKLDVMSDAFFARLVPSEDIVIKTQELAVTLKKVSSDNINGLNMKEGPSRFQLPGNLGQMSDGTINVKVRCFKELSLTLTRKDKRHFHFEVFSDETVRYVMYLH